MHVTIRQTGHIWTIVRARTMAIVGMAQDRILQENSCASVQLDIQENSAKQV